MQSVTLILCTPGGLVNSVAHTLSALGLASFR